MRFLTRTILSKSILPAESRPFLNIPTYPKLYRIVLQFTSKLLFSRLASDSTEVRFLRHAIYSPRHTIPTQEFSYSYLTAKMSFFDYFNRQSNTNSTTRSRSSSMAPSAPSSRHSSPSPIPFSRRRLQTPTPEPLQDPRTPGDFPVLYDLPTVPTHAYTQPGLVIHRRLTGEKGGPRSGRTTTFRGIVWEVDARRR